MHAKHLNTTTIAGAVRQLHAAALVGNAPMLVASPGVGKSSITRPLAKALGLHHQPLIGTTLDGADVGGLPYIDEGEVKRLVIKALREACERPTLLVIEELTCLPEDVKATLLDVLWSRQVGDGEALHARTVIVAVTNPIEQAPNASEPAASLINRFAPIVCMRPGIDEVAAYFGGVLGADPGSEADEIDLPAVSDKDRERIVERTRAWYRDWAATLRGKSTGIVTFDPDDSSCNEGKPWGSPRAWEYALRAAAALEILGELAGDDDATIADDIEIALAGTVGQENARAYLALRKLRDLFDSPEHTAKHPDTAKLPEDVAHQLGALSLIAEVTRIDAYAGWVFTGRLAPELAQAAAQGLLKCKVNRRSKWAKDGDKIRVKLCARVGARRNRRFV
jgi:MoxR-like ATPase